jgi:hypothetical protein
MPTIEARPRPTPEERSDVAVGIEVDEDLTVFAMTLEDWATPRQESDFLLRKGTDFGRANNVEVQLTYAQGEQLSSVAFRLDQINRADGAGEELVIVFEEQDGIAKLARLRSNGLELELFHTLTFT